MNIRGSKTEYASFDVSKRDVLKLLENSEFTVQELAVALRDKWLEYELDVTVSYPDMVEKDSKYYFVMEYEYSGGSHSWYDKEIIREATQGEAEIFAALDFLIKSE